MIRLSAIDQRILEFFVRFQAFFLLSWQAFVRIFHKPYYYRDFAIQFDKLGFSSLFICVLTGLFTGMVMALLGGCWYPLEMFPQTVQNIVKILPTTWAMRGLLDLVLRGQGMAAILPEAGILLGFAAVFFGIGIWRFRYE